MAQILNLHIPTKTSITSSKHNAILSLSKKKLSISYRTKSSSIHIACSVSENTTATAHPRIILVPAEVDIRRSMFPPEFKFGAASSAYQVEGAWNEGGRGPSIWDNFTHEQSNKIKDGSTGDVATDSYNRYKDDVKMMKEMGIDSYRFSISWSRILPDGTLKGGINREGVMYYNNLINELIKNGITPYVTLFHWDVPQALEDKYGGFLDKRIVNDFKDYCQICFREFGDRVKSWITLNEPWTFSTLGYSLGQHAPGHCSSFLGCPTGDSLTEPYIVTHNLILAHAAAAKLYKNHFQSIQGGQIGITLVSMWYKPYSDSEADQAAALRAVEFMFGWYMDPLTNGEYPASMRKLVGERLPEFTKEESEMIKGSYDFLGLNYYTARYAKDDPDSTPMLSFTDSRLEQLEKRGDVPIGDLHGSWIYLVPDGLRELLTYTKMKYNDPKIYITENGTAQLDHDELSKEEAIADDERIDYMTLHLAELRAAIDEGVKVEGYFAWSLTDNFEWQQGYTERFGLNYIDYKNDLARIPKNSVSWYTNFLKT